MPLRVKLTKSFSLIVSNHTEAMRVTEQTEKTELKELSLVCFRFFRLFLNPLFTIIEYYRL